MNGYIIKVYGSSCDCFYVSSAIGGGTLRMKEAHVFGSEQDARNAAVALWKKGEIGHWEIKAAPPAFFPCCS